MSSFEKEIIMIKLDFEKAFDMIEHNTIKEFLKAMGFGEKRLPWTDLISTQEFYRLYMLSGVPGKQLICKKGVRQGTSSITSHICPGLRTSLGCYKQSYA
jgi:hypothetical protein